MFPWVGLKKLRQGVAMDLKAKFQQYTNDVKKLPAQSNDVLLQFYALFKQATDGDVTGSRPGMLDIKGRAKYDAWAKLKGIASDKAMQQYIDLVDRIKK